LEKALNEEPVHALLLNPEKLTDADFVARYPHVREASLRYHAYLYNKEEYQFGQNLLYDDGAYSIQDPAAMMVPYFLAPTPDDIVSICAPPRAAKPSALRSRWMNEGTIIANDISYPRAKDDVAEHRADGPRQYHRDLDRLSSFALCHFLNAFDKIIRRCPVQRFCHVPEEPEEAERDWNPSKVKSCVKRQLELLELSYAMLKEGGTLAYSTCSFSYEEDDGVI
jgi:16S rRNA C967 or C1407 C5-methylase (RsmB/RsmF family)